MNSFNVINYKLRPQKQIERGLIAQLINDFSHVLKGEINYIGMGSLLFADFVYFNKNCHLGKMFSIEKMTNESGEYDHKKEKRFRNNKPLAKIELIPKAVNDAIDDLPLDEPAFIWFDYDGEIETSTIDDLEKLIRNINTSSLIAITYNSGTAKKYKSCGEINLAKIEQDFSDYRMSELESIENFTKDNYSEIASKICTAYLKGRNNLYNSIYKRNFKLEELSKITYKDNAKMTTIIWSFLDLNDDKTPAIQEILQNFEGKGKLDLRMESLTLYEKQQLDRCSEENLDTLIDEIGLDKNTVEKYYRFSRFIPEYSEVYF